MITKKKIHACQNENKLDLYKTRKDKFYSPLICFNAVYLYYISKNKPRCKKRDE